MEAEGIPSVNAATEKPGRKSNLDMHQANDATASSASRSGLMQRSIPDMHQANDATASSASRSGLMQRSTRKRSITIFIVVSLLNVALLGLLWSQLLTPAHNTDTSQGGVSPLVGKPAPNFTLAALSAHSASNISLASFK